MIVALSLALAGCGTTSQVRNSYAHAATDRFVYEVVNTDGMSDEGVAILKARIDAISPDQPMLVVGWSLGGVFARALALAHPERVKAVVTLGSPFSGDPRANNVWKLYEMVAGHKVDNPPIERRSDKPEVPTLAIWSRRDGIVAPAAARGLVEESDRTVELKCTHMAFGVSRRTAGEVVREIHSFLKSVG